MDATATSLSACVSAVEKVGCWVHHGSVPEGRPTMSLAGLGVPAVGLIFRLQLYPTVEFNAERKRREWAVKRTLQAQKAIATVYLAV